MRKVVYRTQAIGGVACSHMPIGLCAVQCVVRTLVYQSNLQSTGPTLTWHCSGFGHVF